MDLVPIVNTAGANAAALSESIASADIQQWSSTIAAVVAMLLLAAFVARIWKRAATTVETLFFTNWRLALLATTGLVLSLASGWTTWDGMRNFTGEPLLSGMITFGIQGVMLIVAWLIGESFATGMNQRGTGGGGWDVAAAGLFAMLAMAAFGIWFGGSAGNSLTAEAVQPVTNWFDTPLAHTIQRFATYAAITAVVAALLITLHQSDVGSGYVQSARIMVKNGVLWMMFLACMATSVFFSFDSLFSTIFPASERERAAELRAQNQVAGIVSDVGQTITSQRVVQQKALFVNKAWGEYEAQLDDLARIAQGSQGEIEKFFVQKMEERRKAIAEQQERMATAESGQAGLQGNKIRLTEELSRLGGDRPQIAVAVQQQQVVVSEIERKLDEQRAVVLAEEKGVEGSGKAGRGKFWRAAKAEEGKLRSQLQVAKERLGAPQKRLSTLDKRTATIKAELAQIDGQIAQLQGEAQTAEQRISASQNTNVDEAAPKIDPARVLPIFERAKADFRQQPTAERLANLQQQCVQLTAAMASTPTTKEKVRGIDCDPKYASEAAAVVFSLNRGAEQFAGACTGGERLAQNKSTDALFEFARRCLADSGLPSASTDALRTEINIAELNRDDKAHRFVVTWNAFKDGNRLAYLALAIAIAIDALVFMSGLFGANAVRSPLQDVPSLKARSAQQLESIVENALLPHVFDSAHTTLSAMQPITPVNGFTQEVLIPFEETEGRNTVLKVLNAGSTIGAVHRDENRPERYLVRPELFEFLSSVAKRAYEADEEHVQLAELRQVISVSLQPYVGDNADIVLRNLTPISRRTGDFSSIIMMPDVAEEDKTVVLNLLNAGTTMDVAKQSTDKGEEDYYLVHKHLYKTLARISAATPKTGRGHGRLQIGAPGGRYGGNLSERRSAVGKRDQTLLNPPQAGRSAGEGMEPAAYDAVALRDHYRAEILDVLGFEDNRVGGLIGENALVDAANDAWQALAAQAQHNYLLSATLADYERRHDLALAESSANLVHADDADVDKQDLAQDVQIEIASARPLLLLHPDLGLIQGLVESLEAGAASDGGPRAGEPELLQRLRNVWDHLTRNDLSNEDAWRNIEGILLDAPEEDMPNVLKPKFNRKGTTS